MKHLHLLLKSLLASMLLESLCRIDWFKFQWPNTGISSAEARTSTSLTKAMVSKNISRNLFSTMMDTLQHRLRQQFQPWRLKSAQPLSTRWPPSLSRSSINQCLPRTVFRLSKHWHWVRWSRLLVIMNRLPEIDSVNASIPNPYLTEGISEVKKTS